MKTDCSIDIKIDGLDKLMLSMKQQGYVKIGILGSNNNRTDGTLTNSQIGVVHEFGSPEKGIVPRSFLRMPLQHEGKAIVKDVASNKDKIMKALLKGDKKVFFNLLAIRAEQAIQDAFDTAGFGSWAAKKKVKNGKTSPLIQEGELRGSINSQVVLGGK